MDMITPKPHRSVTFSDSASFLSDLDAQTVSDIVSSAADLALIVHDGVIQDVALGSTELVDEGYDQSWRGRQWLDVVTPESRVKVEDMLKRTGARGPKWRQVNHPSDSAMDVPIRYTVLPLGNESTIIALGRDVRNVSQLQHRLVQAHQDLERDYTRMREAEARYRLLFETLSEPVLIAVSGTLAIDEANPACESVLHQKAETLRGARLVTLVPEPSAHSVEAVCADALAHGAAKSGKLTLVNGKSCRLSVSAFREDRASRLIVRLVDFDRPPVEADARAELLANLEHLPDGLVIADQDQRIVAANAAFMEMVKVVGQSQAVGRHLGDFIGRSPTDLNVMISTLRNHTVLRNFATVFHDRFGVEDTVEVSAVKAPSEGGPLYGLSIRNVSRRLQSGNRISEQLPRSVEQVTELVGRVPLKDIVRESTDLIEKLCIEAALEITHQNRASAAEVLGLSRQGLYSKLKRAGLDHDSAG
ncbi:MAG: transcriptional regulator PpsR [Pseudomonadota bacterium]